MFWTNPEFCKWCNTIPRITGLLYRSFAGDNTHTYLLGLLPRSPCQNHSHPLFTSLLQRDVRRVLKFGNTGRELREGQGCLTLGTSFTPLLRWGVQNLPATAVLQHPLGPFWPRVLEAFALSKEQLLRPEAAPICLAFAQGHSLAQLGFPLAPPQHTLTCSSPAIAGSATLCCCQQPAVAPVKGCWTLWKFLEGQKHHLGSRLFLMGGRNLTHGQGEILSTNGLFQFLRSSPPASGKANGRVNSILKYWLRPLAKMQKDARKQGFS